MRFVRDIGNSDAESDLSHMLYAIDRVELGQTPFRHWILPDLLPARLVAGLRALPYPAPPADGSGRRATQNPIRIFCDPAAQLVYPVWRVVAALFQHPVCIAALARLAATGLDGTFLRIEYCLDTDGFWLEPHTDIGDKLLTVIVNLSDQAGAEAWGTELLWPDQRLARRVSAQPNSALGFVPGPETWHGFAPRPIVGVRRTVIVNLVSHGWRAVQELAFPEVPVQAAR